MVLEQFANNAVTYLTGDINSTTTSINVNDDSSFPSSDNYRINVDSEIMLVTGGAGTTTWTVTRGYESTTASSHSQYTNIVHVLTKGNLTQARADGRQSGTDANLPAATSAGIQYWATNSNIIYRDTGSAFNQWGIMPELTPPVSANFTWQNQSTAASVTTNGGEFIYSPGGQSGENVHFRYVSTPATPYTVTLGYNAIWSWQSGSFANLGIMIGDGTKLLGWAQIWRATVAIEYDIFGWSNATTYGNYNPIIKGNNSIASPIQWLQLVDDGTNRTYNYSVDGNIWAKFYSETRTCFLIATRVGWYINNGNVGSGYNFGMSVLSWTGA